MRSCATYARPSASAGSFEAPPGDDPKTRDRSDGDAFKKPLELALAARLPGTQVWVWIDASRA